MQYMEINKDMIPYYFTILLGGTTYEVHVNYNSTGDFFTLGLYKDGAVVCAGEPVRYGVPLWQDVLCYTGFPPVKLTALDPADNFDTITYDNMSSTVFLTVEEV